MLSVVLVGLRVKKKRKESKSPVVSRVHTLNERTQCHAISSTHIRSTAVVACCNLRLVCVDVDPGVAGRATASIAHNNLVVCPSDWLLVNKLDGRVWLGLRYSS